MRRCVRLEDESEVEVGAENADVISFLFSESNGVMNHLLRTRDG